MLVQLTLPVLVPLPRVANSSRNLPLRLGSRSPTLDSRLSPRTRALSPVDSPLSQTAIMSDAQAAAANPMRELRIEKLVISASPLHLALAFRPFLLTSLAALQTSRLGECRRSDGGERDAGIGHVG